MLKTRVLIVCFILFASALLSGCGYIPAYTSKNEIYDPAHANLVKRANLEEWETSNVFVGVAISGGGSRSSNFSAAVLEELEKHGFLDHVSAISSVSGGSITAAYFALHRHEKTWSWQEFYTKLREDLEDKAWCRYLYCLQFSVANLFLGGFTHYDRSNLMAEVFDKVYFDNRTFGHLGTEGPKLLINATSLTSGFSTPFLDSDFRAKYYSRLDTFPISHAVMASGAFPGAFHNVTLTNFALNVDIADAHSLLHKIETLSDSDRALFFPHMPLSHFESFSELGSDAVNFYLKQWLDTFIGSENSSPDKVKNVLEQWFGPSIKFVPIYEHLFDGGPSDNWGLNSIMLAARKFSDAKQEQWKGCFVFLIDATASSSAHDKRFEPDTRQGFDFLLDSNALEASDVLFGISRKQMLNELKIPVRGSHLREIELDEDHKRSCMFWNIALQDVSSSPDYLDYPSQPLTNWWSTVPHAAPRIRTRYKLMGIENCSARQHQAILRAAAGLIIQGWSGGVELEEARKWFQRQALALKSYPHSDKPFEGFKTLELRVEEKSGLKRIRCVNYNE